MNKRRKIWITIGVIVLVLVIVYIVGYYQFANSVQIDPR